MNCRTCRFYVVGHCDYRPPAAVMRLAAMAEAEPASKIDWAHELSHPAEVDPDHSCSEWRKAT